MTTQKPKILLTHRVHDDVTERLRAVGDLDMNPGTEPWPYEEVCRRAANATAMMGFMTDQVDETFLQAAPMMRVIACALKGYDSYDAEACMRRGVWLSIVPDLLTEPTAELAIGLSIGLGRHVRHGDHLIRTEPYRGWRPQLYGVGLQDSVVAVVGLGAVGRAIVERLQGFACRHILGVDPGSRPRGVDMVGLEQAQGEADILFLAAPLTVDSMMMLNRTTLARSKPGQLVVNVGRGSVVDENAIAEALEEGLLGGYAADVFNCEDWTIADRPQGISARLLNARNTLFTPHLGSAVHQVRRAIEHRAADNIIDVLSGGLPRDQLSAGPQRAIGGV